ncbi:AzlD domain-containing protein [Bacillota bacterium LX-D]|nr:AzlD domain-containing protein [Bacillota bacterium LX-D]
MNTLFIITILLGGLATYLTRVLPFIFYREKEPSQFVRSFLKYMPYGALGGLLFPGVLTATGNVTTSVIGACIASVLILLRQNMIIVVLGGIVSAYVAEILFKLL